MQNASATDRQRRLASKRNLGNLLPSTSIERLNLSVICVRLGAICDFESIRTISANPAAAVISENSDIPGENEMSWNRVHWGAWKHGTDNDSVGFP